MWAWLKTSVILILLLGLAACSKSEDTSTERPADLDLLENVKTRDNLIVGVRTGYPPFSFVDDSGSIVGLEIDIARYIAKELLGAEDKVQFVPILSQSQRLEALKQGKVDLVIAAISDTQALQADIDLSENYYAAGVGLLTRKDDQISTWNRLKEKTICGVRGAIYNQALANIDVQVTPFRSLDEVFVALQDRRCFGLAYDNTAIAGILRDAEWSQAWHQALPVIFLKPWAIGLPKQEATFKHVVDDAILKMEAAGFIVKSEQKWDISPTPYVRDRMQRAQGLVDINQISTAQVSEVRQKTFELEIDNVLVDGSIAAFPIAKQFAATFMQANPGVRVVVGKSGTSRGWNRFCSGDIDIANAAHSIQPTEMEICQQNGIKFIEVPFAFDGIAVVANPDNQWASCLNTRELGKIWTATATNTITHWNQIRNTFPSQPLSLFGDTVGSGTYNHFAKVILGNSGESRRDYNANHDEDFLTQGIGSKLGSLGFLKFAAYTQNQERVRVVAIQNHQGRCVKPNRQSIASGNYNPLSRPLFFYVNQQALKANPAVKAFTQSLIESTNSVAISKLGYVPLPPALLDQVQARLDEAIAGATLQDESSTDTKTKLPKPN
ncbi:MAG: phosphate ABC transporter substrate-binding protein PstS family protein [Cyanothece sp. SIO1E1]|nr:phosphate ABC transporter substrate-binding protein PstS family protein [Cyanothece sp. SIO1E1]